MADMMTFPNTVEEFMEQYKIVDTEKIYTNGAELVPIFRMMQWFEHVSATDTISRQAAIDATHGRIFQEIVVGYPSYNTNPEYKGKPYFSIKYTENGQEFIGYGTYKPEVLSEYLKEYFMPSAQPEQRSFSCGQKNDAISRQAAIDTIMGQPPEAHYPSWYAEQIKALPSTQPERKTGRWIDITKCGGASFWKCSECGELFLEDFYYCPNCGADMQNESE